MTKPNEVHPAAAGVKATKIIADTLKETGVGENTADRIARCIVARLAHNEPPILLGFIEEFKE